MSRRLERGAAEESGPGDLDDAELAALAGGGDERQRKAAFRELHDRHASYLQDYLRHRFRFNRAATRDVAADAWRRAWAHFHRFDPELAKFRTWLTTIAGNLARNWRRDRSRDPQITFTRLTSGQEEGETDVEWNDSDARPDRKARRRQLRRLVAEAAEELSAAHRTVLQLRERKGLSYGEIGEETGLPLGTVKSRIYRARRELRRHLADRLQERSELLPESLRPLDRRDDS